MTLTPQQIESFRSDGYLLIRGMFSDDEVSAMRQRVDDYLNERRPYPQKCIQTEDGVRDGSLSVEQHSQGYRKLSHITMVDPMFHDMIAQPKFACVLQGCLESQDICAWGSGIFLKQAGTGGRQPWHRDGHGYPGMAATIWTPLMDATAENGAIQVAPGSHKVPVPKEQFMDFITAVEKSHHEGKFEYETRMLEMDAGDTVIWNMNTLHSSEPNRSDRSRWALAVHCVTTEATEKMVPDFPDLGPHEIISGRHDEELGEKIRCAHCQPDWLDRFKGAEDYA